MQLLSFSVWKLAIQRLKPFTDQGLNGIPDIEGRVKWGEVVGIKASLLTWEAETEKPDLPGKKLLLLSHRLSLFCGRRQQRVCTGVVEFIWHHLYVSNHTMCVCVFLGFLFVFVCVCVGGA